MAIELNLIGGDFQIVKMDLVGGDLHSCAAVF
jgi:hypothetical protein